MAPTPLRYLVAIADCGLDITLAAGRIRAARPGVGRPVERPEGEPGFRLLARKGKNFHAPTQVGQQVVARVRVILEESRTIRSLDANPRGDAHGELTLLTTRTQGRFVLPTAIAMFRRQHPPVRLHLRPHGDAQVEGLFANGQACLAIFSSRGPVPLGGLAVPLYSWHCVVVAPRQHPLATIDRHLRLGDLAVEPVVTYDSSLRPGSSLLRTFNAAGLQPRFACTSSDADLIKTYVRAGLGVGILAEMAIRPEESRDLVVLDATPWLPVCTT